MAQEPQAQADTEKLRELAKLRIVLDAPGMDAVPVRKDVPYKTGEGGELGMDVYSPADAAGPLPAVIFVAGYADAGLAELMGFKLKDMGSYVSWAELFAASGIVAITYSCNAPPEDAAAVLRHVRRSADELNVDPGRIGIFAASGNGPVALSLLMQPEAQLRFAVMCNTYMLDFPGSSIVAEMSKAFGFSAPNLGRTVQDLPAETPLFVVRSGSDQIPGLNETMDRFVAEAVRLGRSITFVNLPGAPHSFDTLHDTEQSRDVIRQIVAFVRANAAGLR